MVVLTMMSMYPNREGLGDVLNLLKTEWATSRLC
jgi:hypothetical protein